MGCSPRIRFGGKVKICFETCTALGLLLAVGVIAPCRGARPSVGTLCTLGEHTEPSTVPPLLGEVAALRLVPAEELLFEDLRVQALADNEVDPCIRLLFVRREVAVR